MSNIHDSSRVPLSVRERGLWLVLLTTVAVYVWYFWRAVAVGAGHPFQVGALFADAVIILVVLQIVGQIVIRIRSGAERADERDRLVLLAATQNAYYVLMVGLWGVLVVAVAGRGIFWSLHVVLLAIVLAELTKWASQLYYYRNGV